MSAILKEVMGSASADIIVGKVWTIYVYIYIYIYIYTFVYNYW